MWNANCVSRHNLEVTQFLNDNHIDIMLLVEAHHTNKYNFQIRGCTFYRTDHPDGKPHGGSGIQIRERIKRHFHQRFATNYLQATSIKVQSGNGNLTIAAVYCPPRFTIFEGQFMDFYNLLGERFISAGDYNAKHTHWGSRLVTPKGRQLYSANIKPNNKLDHVSIGIPLAAPHTGQQTPGKFQT